MNSKKRKLQDEQRVSAEVILRPHGGARPESITAANVSRVVPERGTIEKVARWFADRGFTIDASGPMSFSISGPESAFRKEFRMHDHVLERPADLPEEVEEVVFPPPPDFGPGSY